MTSEGLEARLRAQQMADNEKLAEFLQAVKAACVKQGSTRPILKVTFIGKREYVLHVRFISAEALVILADPFEEKDKWLFCLSEISDIEEPLEEQYVSAVFSQRALHGGSLASFGAKLRDEFLNKL